MVDDISDRIDDCRPVMMRQCGETTDGAYSRAFFAGWLLASAGIKASQAIIGWTYALTGREYILDDDGSPLLVGKR